jgi:hypothetical protein
MGTEVKRSKAIIVHFFLLKSLANSADSSPGWTSAWKSMPAAIESIDDMQQHLNQPVLQMVMTKPEKRSIIGHRRHFPLIVTACMGILISSWADTVYLPAVGPSPLRFRPAFKPNTNNVASPSPVLAQPVIPLLTEKAGKTFVPIPPTPVPDSGPTTDQTDANAEPPRSDGVISPQMLLKYFNKSTNGNAAGITAPLDFTPPRAVEPPSSKAEYSTPAH